MKNNVEKGSKKNTLRKNPEGVLFFLTHRGSCMRCLLGFDRYDGNVRPVVMLFAKLNCSVNKRKNRMIFANAYVTSGMVFSPPLANDDVARFGKLSAVNFNSQSCSFRVATLIGKNR
jgi:hypothetical protein